MTFEELGLPDSILRALKDNGYETPTDIQAMAIPEALQGHDLMASAQTGTGKTAAFTLPTLARLAAPSDVRSRGPRALVLTPTRELAAQVADAAKKYGAGQRLSVVTVVGGMPYFKQTQLLSRPVDFLVATPGRLMDLMARGRIDFSRLEVLILDEADRMLDMGFVDDIKQIAAQLPPSRQTLLFSATLDGSIAGIARELLREPKRIQAAAQTDRHANIEQALVYVDDLGHKTRLLNHLLADATLGQAVVFTATKGSADELADMLHGQGIAAAALHGDMNQGARNRTLTKLRRGAVKVLVATDVAARGIDVNGITHVINFDLPKDIENYVHRIGRTGRAGASGQAISFATARDRGLVRRIEHFTGQRIDTRVIPGFEARRPVDRPRSERRPSSGWNADKRSHWSNDKRPGGWNTERRSQDDSRGPRTGGWNGDKRPARSADSRPSSAGAAKTGRSTWGNH